MKVPLVIIAIVLRLAAGISLAQDTPSASGPESSASDRTEGGRTIRFYCMGSEMPQLFYEPKKNHPIEILGALGSLSSAFPMPADHALDIYRQIPPPSEAPSGTQPQKKILASVKMPVGCEKVIILLLPSGDSKTGTLRASAYRDSYQLHPKETVRVFNLAAAEVGLKIGDNQQSFKAGHDGVMPWAAGPGNVVVYQTSVRSGDKWSLVGINERAIRPNLRAFMFTYTADIGGGAPQLCSNIFYDTVPDPK